MNNSETESRRFITSSRGKVGRRMNQTWCEISKEIEFDAGHRVPMHQSKCTNPHGHRYRVKVTCTGCIINDHSRADDGMLIDFGELLKFMEILIHDQLDHGFIIAPNDAELRAAFGGSEWKVIEFP